MKLNIVVALPHQGVCKGESRMRCVVCNKIGEPIKNPSGNRIATEADMIAIIDIHIAKGWRADKSGSRCPTCVVNPMTSKAAH